MQGRKRFMSRLILATTPGLLLGCAQLVGAQEPRDQFISMDDRVRQLISLVAEAPNCETYEASLLHVVEILYANARPLPTDGELRHETIQADKKIAEHEREFVGALQNAILAGKCPGSAGLAVDTKFLVEQMNEVAVAVGRATIGCGEGKPCPDLVPFLDEETGHEIVQDPNQIVRIPFSLKLRSPFVPANTTLDWDEHITSTGPIAPGHCAAIFKETRGLMLRLRLVRFDIVRDPWATAMLARGTRIPVWTLEWVPSQYGKTWNICNVDGTLRTTVSQRVKQDVPLNYFWRYYADSFRNDIRH